MSIFKEEKKIEEAFQQHLVTQMKEHLRLLDNKEYKKVLYDTLNEVLTYKKQ